jgi:hypothetical protein
MSVESVFGLPLSTRTRGRSIDGVALSAARSRLRPAELPNFADATTTSIAQIDLNAQAVA